MGTVENTAHRAFGRRRQYLIDRSFQLKVAGWIALDVFAVTLVGGVLLLNVVEPQVRARLVAPAGASSTASVVTLLGFALGFALLAAGAFSVWSILVTHRLVGPLYVVASGLEQLARGEFPRYRPLRKKDELRQFYATYWRAVHALRSRKQADAAALAEILESAAQATRDADHITREAFERIMTRLRPIYEECARAGARTESEAAERGAAPHELLGRGGSAG